MLQQLRVQDQLLEAGAQAALQPARGVHDHVGVAHDGAPERHLAFPGGLGVDVVRGVGVGRAVGDAVAAGELRSEEHTSELQSLMRISYAVFCLKKKKKKNSSRSTHKHR